LVAGKHEQGQQFLLRLCGDEEIGRAANAKGGVASERLVAAQPGVQPTPDRTLSTGEHHCHEMLPLLRINNRVLGA
jgi:hypothetical protein